MYIIHVVIHVPCKNKTHIDLEGEPSLSDRYHKKKNKQIGIFMGNFVLQFCMMEF